MKKNDLVQIKNLEIVDLFKKMSLIKQEINDLYFDKKMNKLKDIKTFFKKRKELARVLTILRQKELLKQLEEKISQKKGEK